MQTDEDVGKVAMATPVLVCQSPFWLPGCSSSRRPDTDPPCLPLPSQPPLPCLQAKALELFMASLVGAAADETRAANSKKMTPYHLCVPACPGSVARPAADDGRLTPPALHPPPCVSCPLALVAPLRKRTILNTPMFDFLHEQVSSVPDPVASTSAPAARKPRGRKQAPKASSSGGSSDEESSDDERAPRSAAPARKRAKVEVPSVFGIAPPPPPTTGGPAFGLPMVTPSLPPVPGPSSAAYGAGAGRVKREDTESESGSDDEDDDE